ncbi:phosphatidylinositol-binding clathrin assembly protein-like [Cynocephalus volans]|uniref:phosphatidylinositol-binding clathrin assembly protein-like n=1 Tax=Cynocephalus volans TaxID=110931 RepID=UPI002FCBB66D
MKEPSCGERHLQDQAFTSASSSRGASHAYVEEEGSPRHTHGVFCIQGCPPGDPQRAQGAQAETLDLIQYINETNMSVQHLADVLHRKTRSSNWVVVFKALVTVHHLMVHGNERFIQHLASRPSFFTLHSFLDISVIEGYTMSAFIRRYSRYLNEKSLAYRLMASDVTKSKRGRDGVIRAMSTEQLLKTLPVIQTQLDALLNFNANPDELTNGIIRAAFMLLFRDALRLFAAYNEGILNLLDKFFDMRKNQYKESLGIYINFLEKTTKLTQFLEVAEQVGIDQSNIPNLIQPPRSLLEALKQHLASLEEKNISPPCSVSFSALARGLTVSCVSVNKQPIAPARPSPVAAGGGTAQPKKTSCQKESLWIQEKERRFSQNWSLNSEETRKASLHPWRKSARQRGAGCDWRDLRVALH